MQWIWQNKDWPELRFDPQAVAIYESDFIHKAGTLYGTMKHMGEEDERSFTIQLMSEEAVKTSQIEGEIVDRESVQSSIQRQFGLKTPHKKIAPAEQGISEMMIDVYQTYDAPLEHNTLFRWHRMLTQGRQDLGDIGRYRTAEEPMQIVSNRLHKLDVHYEAPHSKAVKREMNALVKWFNKNDNQGFQGALTRSGLAHLYFESIHPFEDGNGRIGRAISEKSLSQNLGRPTLLALAQTIEADKKSYYAALQRNSCGAMDVTDWLEYFASLIIKAQDRTQSMLDFLIAKTKFYDRFAGKLNERQKKVIARMFKEGVEGFKGGLSAENYIRITGAARATATRDLQDLVTKGALTKTGELRYTRYSLNIEA